ncbi:response regulator [Candidatus Laterigemmans baculatus]|uniref:response regulator n=1 Tax=Candidatus Laterigemmans baculatus TaxID=2770505 RepID=UPI0013D9DDE5|nr:response regulator [Candidatus Laterigemmans baculatus]
MLVVSRRAGQDLIFPNLGIVVRVLKVSGRLVKVGVAAPESVKVLRAEVGMDADLLPSDPSVPHTATTHALRNQLNSLLLKLQILQVHLERGNTEEAEKLLEQIIGEAASSESDEEPIAAWPPAVADASHRPRVLAVEDSDNERMLLSYLLVARGFDVSVARDGQEALEILLQSSVLPDFVLMDLNMPMCNGLEALAQIRGNGRLRNLRVYAVTGEDAGPETRPDVDGWDGWFSKPLNVPALLSSLDSPREAGRSLRTSVH